MHYPTGRAARATRSSRSGSRWDGEIEPVYSGINGDEDLTPRQIMQKKQRLDPVRRFDFCEGHPKCMVYTIRSCVCGGEIHFLPDNRAVCNKCQTVFNDGGNTDGLVIATSIFSDGRKETTISNRQWSPRKGEHGHSHINKFIKACKR